MNGTRSSALSKRKADSSPDQGPPSKRAVNGKLPAARVIDVDEDHDDDYDGVSVFSEDVIDDPRLYIGTPGSLGEWQDTIQKVVRNVVAIRFCQTCSFDTDPALTSEATGFVVDAERG
jgi:hypothetical protein